MFRCILHRMARTRRKPEPAARGGAREGAGRRTMFPGKYVGSRRLIGVKLSAVFTQTGAKAAQSLADDLSAREGYNVTISDALEYAVRKVTRTPINE